MGGQSSRATSSSLADDGPTDAFPWETIDEQRRHALELMAMPGAKLKDFLTSRHVSLALQIIGCLDGESVGRGFAFDASDVDGLWSASPAPLSSARPPPSKPGVVSIAAVAKLRKEAERNDHYRNWMAYIDRTVGGAIVDFVEQAGRHLDGESALSALLQLRDALAVYRPRDPLETHCLALLRAQVDRVQRERVMPLDAFVPPALQQSIGSFLVAQLLPLLRGNKSLADVNVAVGQLLDAMSGQLRLVQPVRLAAAAAGPPLSPAQICDVVEQLLLSSVAMFNYHGHDASCELRAASDELQLVAAALHRVRKSSPALALAMEIVAEFFVTAYCDLMRRLAADDTQPSSSQLSSAQLEFSPRNVFFVLMGDFVQQLLMLLPPRLCHAHLKTNRAVLFTSKSLLENATRLLEAEDYFALGNLRPVFQRFVNDDDLTDDARMQLLVTLSAMQFWRVFKGLAKPAAMARLRALIRCAVDQPPPATVAPASAVRLQFLVAAHRIVHAVDNDAGDTLLQLERAAVDELRQLTPAAIGPEQRQQFRVVFRSFVHFLLVQRSASVGDWPPEWSAEIDEFRRYLPSTAVVAAPSLPPSSAVEQLRAAVAQQDLFIAAGLLRAASTKQARPELDDNDSDDDATTIVDRQWCAEVDSWTADFLSLYRRRFDYICPFALSMEAFQLGADGQEPLPASATRGVGPECELDAEQAADSDDDDDEGEQASSGKQAGFLRKQCDVHAYRLSTGSLVSEFGRRGLGLLPLEAADPPQQLRYPPRDPTNRQPVTSYARDVAAERELRRLFDGLRALHARLRRLHRAAADHQLAGQLLRVMRRHLVQFDSSFLEVKLRLLD